MPPVRTQSFRETFSLPLRRIFSSVDQRGMTMSKFIKLIRNTKGATAIEYGLIAALIAVAAIAAMQNIGSKLGETFNNVSDEL